MKTLSVLLPRPDWAARTAALAWVAILFAMASAPRPVAAAEEKAARNSVSASHAAPPSHPYFRITVVDDETGRGIPAVRLKTVNEIEYWTDSAGVVAFYEPDLMDQDVYFFVESHGYTFPADAWFKMHGRIVPVKSGGSATLKMHRDYAAQRLYRMTGSGIYRDSLLLGDKVPPVVEAGKIPVAGQDGGEATVYKGKLLWTWGDTGVPRFPLGVYKGTGALSDLPGKGGLDPEIGVEYTYFRDEKSQVRGIVDMPGRVYWLGQLRTVFDPEGRERLLADYVEIENPMRVVERGLVEFNDDKGVFQLLAKYPDDSILPFDQFTGPPMRYSENGIQYFYYPSPYPSIRCPVDYRAQTDFSLREAFTCLKDGSRFDGSKEQLDRDADGRLRWTWKRNTDVVSEDDMRKLIESGAVRPEEQRFAPRDIDTGQPVYSHAGSVFWNEYRKRWVCLRLQGWGVTLVGEVWYLEGDTPLGPWIYARKIATHKWKDHDYAFYTLAQIPEFDKNDGREIFFRGSFSAEFGDQKAPVPRYNYNVMAYKLHLDDPRVVLPVPVYRVAGTPDRYGTKEAFDEKETNREIVWFAPDRPAPNTVPVYAIPDKGGRAATFTANAPNAGTETRPVFHAVPFQDDIPSTSPLAQTVPLNEFNNAENGKRIYTTKDSVDSPGFERNPKPVCRVWPNPILFNPYADRKK